MMSHQLFSGYKMGDLNELKARISHEFSVVEPPKIDEIANPNDWDAEAINEDFSRFLSKPVNVSVFESHAKSLPAFTPRAFVYFLKDYMLYALEHLDSELTEHLVYILKSLKKRDSYWEEKLKLLTLEQVNVVVDFCSSLKEMLLDYEDYLKECLDEAIVAWAAVSKEKQPKLNG